ASERSLWLFDCGCCRRAWDMLREGYGRHLVEVQERFADGPATREERGSGHTQPDFTQGDEPTTPTFDVPTLADGTAFRRAAAARSARGAVLGASRQVRLKPAVWERLWETASEAGRKAGTEVRRTEREEQTSLIHCIFRNPFCPAPSIEPHVLAWQDGA